MDNLINTTVPVLETRADLRPEWDEKRQAVYIPAVKRWLDAEDLDEDDLGWEQAEIKAMKAGRRLPSREEALALMLYAKDINAVLAEHGHRPMSGWYWTGTCEGRREAWYIWMPGGEVSTADKYERRGVRCISE